MTWILASLIAAFFLGLYELCNKHAVGGNAVFPVIFLGTVCSAAVWAGLIGVDRLSPGTLAAAFTVDPLSWKQHGQILVKSVIVAVSWVFTYFAVKHLPVSIAGPVRSTGPLWTFTGALVLFGERPHFWQTVGVVVILLAFWALSLAGRAEGIAFHRDKWIGFLALGTLLGSVSGLYDKHLMGTLQFRASTVQAWFQFYLVLLFLPIVIGWKRRWWVRGEFHWRWSIPFIGLTLLVSDYLYFWALRNPEALVSVVTAIRRTSVLVGFVGGLFWLGERNGWKKLPAVLGLLAGVAMIVMG
ncbi:MAG: DMT family transporter [Opitutaceae bacterium]